MASASVMEEALGKTQLPPSLQAGSVIQTLNNNHISASASSPQSPHVDPASSHSSHSSPNLNSLQHKFAEFLNLSPSFAKDKIENQDRLKTIAGNGECVVNVSPLHDSVRLLDTAHRHDLPTPSLSPSFPIKTPIYPIYYSYFYGSEHDSGQEFEGTEYDWGEEMVIFEQLDRYGDAIFSSSPPYVPFDYNTLNPDLDPDDSNYYVHVPEYEYVTLTDDEDYDNDDEPMLNVDNDDKVLPNTDNDYEEDAILQLPTALLCITYMHPHNVNCVADSDFAGPKERAEIGQIESVWKDIASMLSKAVKDALDPEQVQDLMLICRIVRNGVAGVTENQDQASNLAAIEDETVVLSTVMLCYNCVFESSSRSALLFSTAAGRNLLVRLISESNAISNKEERKSFEMIYTLFNHLISQGFFEELFKILASQDEAGSQEDYQIRYHGENIPEKDEGPKIQELKLEEAEDQETIKKGTPRSYLSTEQVVLLKMIDSKIYAHHERLQEQYQKQQQHRARPTATANEQNAVSNLFKVDETEPPVEPATVESLSTVFAKVSAQTIEVLRTLDQPGVGGHGVEDLANLSSGLMLLLGCFSHLSLHEEKSGVDIRHSSADGDDTVDAQDDVDVGIGPQAAQPLPDWFKAQHMTMVKAGLVENAIVRCAQVVNLMHFGRTELLRQADKSLARVTKPVSTMPSSTSESMAANTESSLLSDTSTLQGQQSFFVGLKRDIVRLVGNLAYRSRHVQDRIRQCNGLIVMLSQCNIDDANPYLREYAILAMKNILSGNPENQSLIEELQPIEAVDHPALQEARVTSRLDAETGRPVLSQKPRPC
ncbi:hypothetical protein BGZ70_001499 [Mortierella alpina]|uniref:Ataxin-10 homolog n=1 Tax=Mortierella alpina TaxID=64518 RepID=A0A9P6LY17_MORAP|nr:hypothetical protein BGZ70_001499 [Mortierella alpina]